MELNSRLIADMDASPAKAPGSAPLAPRAVAASK